MIYTSDDDRYLHLPGLIVAENATGDVRYLMPDGLGSIRQAVDSQGQVAVYHEFDPYGSPVENGGDPYGFTGEWWEDAVSLLHLRARWYAPGVGVFLSKDAFEGVLSNPATLNGYNYANQNPINFVDPSGNLPPPIEQIARHLRDRTEACYKAGDLECVWNNYFLVAYGGQWLGLNHAARNLLHFLYAGGDIEHGSHSEYSYWLSRREPTKIVMAELEQEVLVEIHRQAKNGRLKGQVQTGEAGVSLDSSMLQNETDLYYAMNNFTLSTKADYTISQDAQCNYKVPVKFEYHYFDPYNWHQGLAAGGGLAGVSGFKDEWTAALHDAGLAQEYEISGSFIDWTFDNVNSSQQTSS